MLRKICAFLLIAALAMSFSACSLLGFLTARTEAEFPEVENPNSFVGGNSNGAMDATHIIIQNGGNGITVILPDQTAPQETEPQETEPVFQGSIPLHETWYYFHQFDESNGRLGQLDFYDDNTFTLTTFYYMRNLDYDDVFWYCPGTETSGVDTPVWEGTYVWDGDQMSLTVENYVQITWEQPNDWSPPEPVDETLVPVNKVICMQLNYTDQYGHYMESQPLPLTSDFSCAPAGDYIFFFDTADMRHLFP